MQYICTASFYAKQLLHLYIFSLCYMNKRFFKRIFPLIFGGNSTMVILREDRATCRRRNWVGTMALNKQDYMNKIK